MADLAVMMTLCKEPNNIDNHFRMSDFTDQLFQQMKVVPWTDEHVEAINKFAKKLIKPGRGIVVSGSVVGHPSDVTGKFSGVVIRAGVLGIYFHSHRQKRPGDPRGEPSDGFRRCSSSPKNQNQRYQRLDRRLSPSVVDVASGGSKRSAALKRP